MNKLISKSLEQHKFKEASQRWEILKIEVTELAQYYGGRIASEKRILRNQKVKTDILQKGRF